jgi:hypothetical protein
MMFTFPRQKNAKPQKFSALEIHIQPLFVVAIELKRQSNETRTELRINKLINSIVSSFLLDIKI